MSTAHRLNVSRKTHRELRRLVFERDLWTCQRCGLTLAESADWDGRRVTVHSRRTLVGRVESDYLEVDHVIPRSRGGVLELENLQALCHSCNRHKAARLDYDECETA